MSEDLRSIFGEKRKIENLSVYLLSLRLKKPFEVSFGRIEARPVIIVEVKAGETGWGEVPVLGLPLYNSEDVASSLSLLGFLSKILPGKEWTVRGLSAFLDRFRGRRMAAAGIIEAFLGSLFLENGLPELPSKRVPLQESIPLGGEEETASWVKEARKKGISNFKLKVTRGSLPRVKWFKEEFSPEFLSLDANAVFDPLIPGDFKEAVEMAGLANLFEQPFRPKNFVAHWRLFLASGTPIALDESVEGLGDLAEAFSLFPAVLNLKPPRVGGPFEAWRLCRFLAPRKGKVFLGGMLETGLGRAFNLLSASFPGIGESFPSDFSLPSEFYEEDTVGGEFQVEDGFVSLFLKEENFVVKPEVLERAERKI